MCACVCARAEERMDSCGSADVVVCVETGSQCTAVTDSEPPL